MPETAAVSMRDMERELTNLKERYASELNQLDGRVKNAVQGALDDRFSDHDAFNMAASTQNLAVLAGKIKQTENVIRWMGEWAK